MRIATLAAGLLLAASGAFAAETAHEPEPGIVHVTGTAHRRLPNTVADITFAIEVEARDIATVNRQLGEKSQALMAWLRGQNTQRLSSTGISVDPRMHTPPGGPETIVGYSGNLQVSFRCESARAGDLITGGLAHGANTLQSASFSPGDEELRAARRELAAEATHEAMDEARAIAQAAGEHVVRVRLIDLAGGRYMPMPMRMAAPAARAAAPAPPPVATEAGDQDVSVSADVQVVISP